MGSVPLALSLAVGDRIRLTPDGRIVDFIDPKITRPNTPEEHLRQGYARKLHYEYDYAKDVIVIGAPVNIGHEAKYADIVVYQDAQAARQRDQAKVRIIV